MICLVVEGSSCALDLVCVVPPCPVIGSCLLAAACTGGCCLGASLRQCHMVSSWLGRLGPRCHPTQLCGRVCLLHQDNTLSLHCQDTDLFLNHVGSRLLMKIIGLYEIWKRQAFFYSCPSRYEWSTLPSIYPLSVHHQADHYPIMVCICGTNAYWK